MAGFKSEMVAAFDWNLHYVFGSTRRRAVTMKGCFQMTCCDALAAECPLDLTEDDCRTLIRLLRHLITPDRAPLPPQFEPLRVILEKLEFAIGD